MGNINNRGDFTSVTLDLSQSSDEQVPDLSYLAEAVNNSIGSASMSAATLTTTLFYNPTTQILTYQNIPGQTLAGVLNLLQHLTIQTGVDNNGIPITTRVSVINPATAQALLKQYNADNVASALEPASDVDNSNPGLPPDGTVRLPFVRREAENSTFQPANARSRHHCGHPIVGREPLYDWQQLSFGGKNGCGHHTRCGHQHKYPWRPEYVFHSH